jgi:GH15 family glucan-1,4-alpha-glucosidase
MKRFRTKDGSKFMGSVHAILSQAECKACVVSAEKKYYGQSYEDLDIMDSAVLIMPLVFFTSAADERFKSTLDAILRTPEKGGLTANNTVFRYDTEKADDGIGGEEGAFSMCTLWAIGQYSC